jgi:hypothetical protein
MKCAYCSNEIPTSHNKVKIDGNPLCKHHMAWLAGLLVRGVPLKEAKGMLEEFREG